VKKASLRHGDTKRLRKKDFEEAYSKGRKLHGKLFIAYIRMRRRGGVRLGVVASRRVGGAVERNRAKRLLREVFRKNKPEKAVPADVVLIARSLIKNAKYSDVEKDYIQGVFRTLEKACEKPG
jgi:ribonuclease P protein component